MCHYNYAGSPFLGHNTSPYTIILGEDYKSIILFYATLGTSIISASLGLTKCLLYGVARTISQDGSGDGILSGRFLVASLASGAILISRAAIFSLNISVNIKMLKTK